MQTKYLCVLIHIWTKGEVGTPSNGLKPSSKIFYWPFQVSLLLWIIYVISVLFLLCFRARLFIDALWSPAGKGPTSWLSFVISNSESCHFPIGILGQVWCLIVSIPDLCPPSNFYSSNKPIRRNWWKATFFFFSYYGHKNVEFDRKQNKSVLRDVMVVL